MSTVLTAAAAPLVILLLWQVAIVLLAPPSYIFPAPATVFETLAAKPDHFLKHTLITLQEIGLGLFFGTIAGVVTAIGVASFPRTGRLVWPLVLVAQALPVFAIAPLLVLWFGFGTTSKVVMTSLIIFFPVASAFADGIRRTDRDLLDFCALTDGTHRQILWRVRLPLALPGLVSGLRVAAPLAPLGAIVGEWVGASGGLGFIMLQANARMQTADVFAGLAILAFLTLALRAAIDLLSPLLVPWARENGFQQQAKP
ncbi:ABC transporter permease [Limoniibacter endophyticus]|uniref:ABC transporter permease n=1 Tax=Limoniibacter endophyticus TaxID=1565040 RepID=UPI00361B0E92